MSEISSESVDSQSGLDDASSYSKDSDSQTDQIANKNG